MRKIFVLLAVLLMSVAAHAQMRKVDFEQDAVGQPPQGSCSGLPGKSEHQAAGLFSRKREASTSRNSMRIEQTPVSLSRCCPTSPRPMSISVRVQAVSGRVDQAGGLVWRFQDEDNYYLVRANALEDNVVLYKVQNGRRTDLPVKGEGRTTARKLRCRLGSGAPCASRPPDPRFEVYFNGNKLYTRSRIRRSQGRSRRRLDEGRFGHAV